ncbi:MAG: hypothetical protein JJ974_12100, partial [Phycisphaerales bacterium]|nr:hypothetical protein [Phycisphaerales bacterium]
MKTLCSPIALLKKYTLRSALPAIAAVLMISSISVQALAQDSDPEWKVVTTETEAVRCGDQDIYYTITEVQRGAIFAVDGTSGDYSKVRYPADLGAVVRADEVRVIKAGTQVQLTKESMLKAESMLRGLAGSWNTVYTTPLPADTVLSVLDVIYEETTDGSRGEVLGYRVAPPRP